MAVKGSGGKRNGRNIEEKLISKFVQVIPLQPILNQTNFDEIINSIVKIK